MSWFLSELRLVQRPMLRWWLRVGSWWIGAALLLFVLQLILRVIIEPWLVHFLPTASTADMGDVPGPLGLTETEWEASMSLLSHLRLLFCYVAWFLAADKVVRLRSDLIQDAALPVSSKHRQSAYLLALVQGVLPLTAIKAGWWIESGLKHLPYFSSDFDRLGAVYFNAEFMVLLLVLLVILKRQRWIAWAWLLGLQIAGTSLFNFIYDVAYFQWTKDPWGETMLVHLSQATMGLGFAWELGGLLVLGTLWLLARGYLKQAAPLLIIISASSLLSTFGCMVAAPAKLQSWNFTMPVRGGLQPDMHTYALMDVLRGPQEFIEQGVAELDQDPEDYSKALGQSSFEGFPDGLPLTIINLNQPFRWQFTLPKGFSFVTTLINLGWTALLVCIVFFWILPEPRREEALL